MKVLIITPYFYDETKRQFAVNKTGFGFLMKDIASYGARLNEVFMLSSAITPECEISGFHVVSHTWVNVIKNIKVRNVLKGIYAFYSIKQDFKNRLKHIYYAIDSGYTEKVIKKLNPDIVHFHAVGYRTELWIDICEKLGVKYVLTLHGLVGFQRDVTLEEKKSEKKLLEKASVKKKPITVISTGIKNRIKKGYGIDNNIIVVTNGTNVIPIFPKNFIDIHAKHNIPPNRKIMLCVGNISKNKNQEQLIRAFDILSPIIKKKLHLLILGNINHSLKLDTLIDEMKLTKHIKLCGFVNKEDLISYFKCADYNVLVSIDEGFGLSIIEAFSYGIPTVTFPDLDAVPDLYDKRVMVLANERSDHELALAIEKMCNLNWDRDFIREYAKKFSLERMAKEYNDVYLKAVREDC